MAPAKKAAGNDSGRAAGYTGMERFYDDELSTIEKARARFPWFDHLMRMSDRYSEQGGNHFAAGITYFSVLSLIPIMLIVFAGFGFVLAGNDAALNKVQQQILNLGTGGLQETLQSLVDVAVQRRSSIGIIGLLTALWTGLGWMGNLRLGVSEMWKVKITPDNFVKGKLSDLVGLVGLLAAFTAAFVITAIGSSSLTKKFLEYVELDSVPGIHFVTWVIAFIVGLLANYIVFVWLLKFLPREQVPWRSVLQAAAIGAFAFELIKQFGAVFISSTMSNPAAAAFGPVIAIMVLFYLIWRVVLYCSAWAATTQESRKVVDVHTPPPAIISVRGEEADHEPTSTKASWVGAGAVVGAIAVGLVGVMSGRESRQKK
ncbi:YhjD/YihY/BrkB family envelope integrity protein [Corynebacterium kroppenstedtii]|uniref:YhjD/YihY/BrkB family envelope integrity protein n=1 Tax=Corynebacterium sp. PCR 32 TaxID=3351342 RepID=UPI00309EDF73